MGDPNVRAVGDQSEVLAVERDGHVVTVWLDDADRRNAMGEAFWRELPVVFGDLADDDGVRAVVLAAKGSHFTAGLDLAILTTATGTPAEAMAFVHRLQAAVDTVADCPKPVIAAVQGACIGGGIDLVTACDIRLAAPDAVFSVRETRMAMVADLGTLQRLPRIVGAGHAAELVYTGADVDATRAKQIGLVNDVAEDVVGAARALAATIAANAPRAVQGAKDVMRRSADLTVAEGLELAATTNVGLLGSDDLREAVTAFLEKRPPVFRGT